MHASFRIRMITVCGLGIALGACAVAPKAPVAAKTPTGDRKIVVERYSENPLSGQQSRVLNEATKLSFACRLYRYYYGKWPANLDDIRNKTTGIDFEVFKGRAEVTPNADDSEDISIYDGENVRTAHATPIDFHMPKSEIRKAQSPGFKIDMGGLQIQASSN